MMFEVRKNLITTFLIFTLLIYSILGCVLAFQSYFVVHQHSDSHVATCCDNGYMLGISDHSTPFILSDIGAQFLLLVFVSIYLFFRDSYLTDKYNLNNYFRTRYRDGGFKSFYYIINLFRRGILHPKIY